MGKYLESTDPGAFDDYPRRDALKAAEIGLVHECLECKGHGGWNLTLNAYPLHGKENTPENRHRFSHFRVHCSNCNGMGYVRPENADHIHKWEHAGNAGNCLNLYRCSGCGQEWMVDSSD